MVEIICHFNRVADRPRVDPRLKGKGYSTEAFAAMKEKVGQISMKSLNVSVKDPDRFIYPYFDFVYELYVNYKRGILPYDGSLVDQPNKIIEIFNLLSNLENERDEIRLSKSKEIKPNGRRRN